MGSTDDDTNHYGGALLEEIRDNMKSLAEGMSSLKGTVEDINGRMSNVERNSELIPVIKTALTDQSHQVTDHEQRISSLEHATN